MNKPIRIKGWIDNAYKEGGKYVLKLHPEYSQIFDASKNWRNLT